MMGAGTPPHAPLSSRSSSGLSIPWTLFPLGKCHFDTLLRLEDDVTLEPWELLLLALDPLERL